MSKIKEGDIVRIKDRADWPTPPGYSMAGAEGDVTSINDEEGFVTVHLVKTYIDWAKGNAFVFRLENVEKV